MSLLLIIAPTHRELGGVRPRPVDGVAVATVGLGSGAGSRLGELVARSRPGVVVSLGFVGALVERMRPGDLVLATRSVTPESRAPIAHDEVALAGARVALATADVGVTEGSLLTVMAPLLTSAAKREGRDAGAVVVDMEGYWLAAAAAESGIPLVAVRAVLDEAGYDLPRLVSEIVEDGGHNEWRHTLRALRNPLMVGALVPLAVRSRRAGRALRRAAEALLLARASLGSAA